MAKRSKRYRALSSKLTAGKKYSSSEAVKLLKEAPTKFDSMVELHFRLGIDPKKSEQSVRGSVQLPHGSGKQKRIIAFVGSNDEAAAKEAGADIIGTNDVIKELKASGKINFDVAVASPEMMKQLAPVARLLGQKGLMPNPKTETVGPDIKKIITSLKHGRINFKNDSTSNVHLAVGKLAFSEQQLVENIQAAVAAIRRVKPASAKGIYLRSITLTSTMGPGIPLSVSA